MSETSLQLTTVFDQTLSLARRLPGPLRRVSVRCGEAAVEIDWHDSDAVPTSSFVESDQSAPPEEDVHTVAAPLVGTFYRAPAPGAEPFIQVGSRIEVGQTLGIVEAMKLLNPIVSEVAGEVLELLVGDAESVQYEQPLVRVALTGDQAAGQAVALAG